MVEESGLSKPTILKGIREVRGKRRLSTEEQRVRKPGGGRKLIEERDPDITRLLEQVMDESYGELSAGEPEGQRERITRRPGPAVWLHQSDLDPAYCFGWDGLKAPVDAVRVRF